MINLYNQHWVFSVVPDDHEVEGICVCPFIFYTCAKGHVPEGLRRHEEYHWRHQLRWLVIPWFIVYGVLWIFYGYYQHPWEKLAREAENDGS